MFWPVLIAAWALAQQPSAQSHFERGRALFEEHDDTGDAIREAAAEFRQALALDPRLAAALAYLGFIAAEENRLADAEAAYRKALVLDPQSPEARVGLARLAIQQNRYPEAVRLLRMAVAAVPDHRLARRELALYLTHENSKPTTAMWEEAIECWKTLIRLD
ncbi:MAG: tetratricopeptide repeat protein, partial [Acidobacteria bacterium]|nr:tetratricopeptide repeat protein [Acidobacteriota bacterium]